MSSKTYIPRSDTALLIWIKKLLAYTAQNMTSWHITAPLVELNAQADAYGEALGKTLESNHGSIDVHNKNVARQTLEKTARAYIQGFLARNPYVTDADRKEMGLPVYDTVPTSVSDPLGQATAEISYPGRTQLRLHVKHVADTPIDTKASYGCRIYYSLYAPGEEAPTSGKDLRLSMFTRRKKEIFNFQPEDSGKTAYFSIRYENSKGKTGPWGPLFSAIIP